MYFNGVGLGQTSVAVLVRPSIGGSITVATYPNALCSDSDADYIPMGAKYVNTDACFKGNMKLRANMTAFTASYADSPVSPPKPGTSIFDQKSREKIIQSGQNRSEL